MPYGNNWRIHRKLFHRFFNVAVEDQFDDKIRKSVNLFLHRLSESPGRFLEHAKLYVSLHSILVLSRLTIVLTLEVSLGL